jgi:hypothetical protein
MLRMRQRAIGLVATALVLLNAARTAAQEPVAVISIKNVDALVSDLKYILSAGGSPELSDLVDNMIDQMTQGKGLAGIDRTKPLGAYMTLNAGNSPDFVIFVPVTDNRTFREDFLSAFFSRQQEVAGGIFSVQSEGQQFYGKFANGHCFLSALPATLNKLPDPARIARSRFTFNLEADLSRMPDEVKDGLVEKAEEAVRAAEEEQANPPSELEARVRDRGQKMMAQFVRMLIKETDRMSLGIDVDQKSKLVALDIGLVAKPGSSLAQSLATYSKTTSSFAALVGPDAAASMILAAPISDQLREYLRDAIESNIEQARLDIDKSERLKTPEQREAAKDLMQRLMKIVKATGETGLVDGVVAAYGTPDGMAQIIAASKVASGDELTKTLEEFVKQHAGTPEADKVKLNLAQHAGARIHAISLELDEDAKQYFASGTAHLAIRKDTVFFAIGGDSLAAVKSSIDKVDKPTSATGKGAANRPPVSIRLQPSKLVAIFGKGDDPNITLAREAFTGDGDHISLELFAMERGARLRLELGEGFLRFIALSISQQIGNGGVERE